MTACAGSDPSAATADAEKQPKDAHASQRDLTMGEDEAMTHRPEARQHLAIVVRFAGDEVVWQSTKSIDAPLRVERGNASHQRRWRWIAFDAAGNEVHRGGMDDPTELRVPAHAGVRGADGTVQSPPAPAEHAHRDSDIDVLLHVPTSTQKVEFYRLKSGATPAPEVTRDLYEPIGHALRPSEVP